MTTAAPSREEAGHAVLTRLAELHKLAADEPDRAREEGWRLLLQLGRDDDRDALHALWLAGEQPVAAPGRTIGKNLARVHDIPNAWLQNLALKRDPWTGKTIGETEGYNRLQARALRTVRLLSRRRAPWFDGAEVAAFPFDVELTEGVIAPHRPVLAIDYAAPRHGNPRGGPFPFGRIRDEIVELVDGLYVARVLFLVGGEYRHIAAFGLSRDS